MTRKSLHILIQLQTLEISLMKKVNQYGLIFKYYLPTKWTKPAGWSGCGLKYLCFSCVSILCIRQWMQWNINILQAKLIEQNFKFQCVLIFALEKYLFSDSFFVIRNLIAQLKHARRFVWASNQSNLHNLWWTIFSLFIFFLFSKLY